MTKTQTTDISIQFHALPEELSVFVKQCVIDLKLSIVAIKFFPFGVSGVSVDALDEVFLDPAYQSVALSLGKPSLPASNQTEFSEKNPDRLNLDIGRKTLKGLEESWLNAHIHNPEALKVWKQIAKRLKAETLAGAIAVNSKTGATARIRDHRFMRGAKAAEAEGVPMLSLTGVLMRLENNK